MAMATFQRLLTEAADTGFDRFFLTGGEPFILPDIYERIGLATGLRPTTVLTNAMLLHGARLERLLPLRGPHLTLQVSVDGHVAAIHDSYRGAGSWTKSVERIRDLLALGFHVAVGATETPVNAPHVDELRQFVAALGVAPEDFFIRPLARRGFSTEGEELGAMDLVPELTANNDGLYWHPLTTEDDLLVTRRLFPLRDGLSLLHEHYHELLSTGARPRPFK